MNLKDYILIGFDINIIDLMFLLDFSYSDMHPSYYGYKISIEMLLTGEYPLI